MIPADTVAAFVERMKRERVEQGLAPTITDGATLRVVAALAAKAVGHAAA